MKKATGKGAARATRVAVPVDVMRIVLHEAAYKCANPTCRMVFTLDTHHIDYVSEGGGNDASNLLPLCGACHDLHHAGYIPKSTIRAWKMLILALNEAFDRRSVDLLLMLDIIKTIVPTHDGMIAFAPLIASGLVYNAPGGEPDSFGFWTHFRIMFTPKGQAFVTAWKAGDLNATASLPTLPAPPQ